MKKLGLVCLLAMLTVGAFAQQATKINDNKQAVKRQPVKKKWE